MLIYSYEGNVAPYVIKTTQGRNPKGAALWQMHTGFDQPGFSHGDFAEQDFDDLLGGSAEAPLRASCACDLLQALEQPGVSARDYLLHGELSYSYFKGTSQTFSEKLQCEVLRDGDHLRITTAACGSRVPATVSVCDALLSLLPGESPGLHSDIPPGSRPCFAPMVGFRDQPTLDNRMKSEPRVPRPGS